MHKFFLLFILVIGLCLITQTLSKELPPTPFPKQADSAKLEDQVEDGSFQYYCNVTFYDYFGDLLFTENIDPLHPITYNNNAVGVVTVIEEGENGNELKNQYQTYIDSYVLSGTDCDCWVVLFQGASLTEMSLGILSYITDTNQYLQDYMSYDQVANLWFSWDNSALSYEVSCNL